MTSDVLDESLKNLLVALESENVRKYAILQLPFECEFPNDNASTGREQKKPQVVADQQYRRHCDRHQSSLSSLDQVANSHQKNTISTPTLVHPLSLKLDHQQHHFDNLEVNLLQHQNSKFYQEGDEAITKRNFRDGIPADDNWQVDCISGSEDVRNIKRASSSGKRYELKSQQKFLSQPVFPNFESTASGLGIECRKLKSTNEELYEMCRKLRQFGRRCRSTKLYAAKCQDDLLKFEAARHKSDELMTAIKPVRTYDDLLARNFDTLTSSRGFTKETKKSNGCSCPSITYNNHCPENSLMYSHNHYFHQKHCQNNDRRKQQNNHRDNLLNAGEKHCHDLHRQRLEVAAERLPLIGRQLTYVMKLGSDRNLVFEFLELLDRRMRLCEQKLKHLMTEACNIPRTKRQFVQFEICAGKRDIQSLDQLLTNIRRQLKIQPTDDYISRREAARKHAGERQKQLQILENSIGQVML